MKRKFAAFDVDGTLGRTSLFLQIVEKLFDSGHLPDEARKELQKKLIAYRQRQHRKAFKDYSGESVKILFDHITSIELKDYRRAVDEVISESHSHLHVYTRELVHRLKSEGYFLIALSGSEMYTVTEFLKHAFDFDVIIGETYETKNGYFTGKANEVFHKKDLFLKELITEHNLTTTGSVAVGDSMGDLSMLKYVEQPIAFNPEDSLYEEARKNGWKIVIERKNVIYELEPDTDGAYKLL
jgi:HAD superfamily phosphoserine phosphatase-like hydrolase